MAGEIDKNLYDIAGIEPPNQRSRLWDALQKTFAEEECPGHVASVDNAKICARCGTHIDDLRPPEEQVAAVAGEEQGFGVIAEGAPTPPTEEGKERS